jgi:cation diffusion facilitator family transporter
VEIREQRSFDPPRRARQRAIARVLVLVLVANLAVAIAKLAFGAIVGGVALWADGLHSLLDGTSNIVGLVGITVASKQPDREHPYGHRRFETLAATVIGLLIALGLSGILAGLVRSMLGAGSDPHPTPLAAAVVAATAVINTVVSRIEARYGKKLQSSLLSADAAHSASDALASIVVLASFGGAALGWPWADAVAAIFVSILIARTAWRVLRHNIGVLVDRAPLDAAEIREVAIGITGVIDAHRIRSRGLADHVHVDLCVHLPPEMTLGEAHERCRAVISAIEARFPEVADVVVQSEPDGHTPD